MSEYVGQAFVKVVPDTRGFATQLSKEVDSATTKAGSRPGRAGVDALLADTRRLKGESASLTQSLKSQNAELVKTRGLTVGGAIGLGVLGIAARNLTQDFSKWSQTQGEVVKGLGQIAQGVSNLDLLTTGKGIANFAAGLNLRGEGQATSEANAATARANQRDNALALAQKLLDLREQTAKAEGTVGTAAGRTRFELEKQLKAAEAQYKGLAPNLKRVAAGQFGLNPDLSNKVAPAATDASRQSDFELAALRAGRSKSIANDRALFQDREKFLKGQITYLENAGAKSQAAKDRLKVLYGQLDSIETQLDGIEQEAAQKRQARLQARLALAQTGLQIQAANARTEGQETAAIRADAAFARTNAKNKNLDAQTRAGYALQAANDDKQIFEIQKQQAAQAKQAAEEAKRLADQKKKEMLAEQQAERERIRSIKELRLQNRIAAAQLTKGTGDDKKAINANIAYWQNIIRTTRGLQREQARAQVISLRGQLQGIQGNQNGPAAATNESFFAEAANQFKTYGSNISASSRGVLSGQDARARLAQIAIGNRGNGGQNAIVQGLDLATRAAWATAHETQVQTQILRGILTSINGAGTTKKSPFAGRAISFARAAAISNGGGI